MKAIQTLPGYTIKKFTHKFTTMPMWYFMYIPITQKRYDTLHNFMLKNYSAENFKFGMIERPTMFGKGFIGIMNEDEGDTKISGEFIMYEYKGLYKGLKQAFDKIKKDYGVICDVYQIYTTDPRTTKPEENITEILFRPKN